MSDKNAAIRFVADRLISKWFPYSNSGSEDLEVWEEIALDDAEIAIDAYIDWLKNNE